MNLCWVWFGMGCCGEYVGHRLGVGGLGMVCVIGDYYIAMTYKHTSHSLHDSL